MRPWKTLSRRTVLMHPPFLALEQHAVQLPDGRIIPDWYWIDTPDFVCILPQTADGHFLLFRQTKYAVDGLCLAPVGGLVEPGESPQAAAERELLEETGHVAAEWTFLGTYVVDANRGAGKAHLFLARQACRVGTPTAPDLEEQELLVLSRQEIEHALAQGEFKVLAWAALVALSLRHLDSST